jgi:xanthine/CO dehydrogenase XdhC/CoxF family maturation factor
MKPGLVEPVTAGNGADVLRFLAVCHNRRQPGRIATIFESGSLPTGARVLVWPDESVTANFASPDIENSVLEALAETSGRRAAIRQIHLPCGQVLRVLLETIAPTTSLLLCGAGDDAIPVANLAKDLGWRVTVIDPRSEFAEPSRFPNVDSILRLHPSEVLKGGQVDFSPESVAMIMTHHFQRDKEFLRLCLPRCPRYTGVLGPRVRTQRIIDELSAEGVTFAEDQLSRLHGPAGLDLGAETPAEGEDSRRVPENRRSVALRDSSGYRPGPSAWAARKPRPVAGPTRRPAR